MQSVAYYLRGTLALKGYFFVRSAHMIRLYKLTIRGFGTVALVRFLVPGFANSILNCESY